MNGDGGEWGEVDTERERGRDGRGGGGGLKAYKNK